MERLLSKCVLIEKPQMRSFELRLYGQKFRKLLLATCGFIIAIVLSVPCAAQSSKDSLLFAAINQFRADEGMVPVAWDSCMWHAAKHQANYQCIHDKVTHDQRTFGDGKKWNADYTARVEHFCPQLKREVWVGAENVGPAIMHEGMKEEIVIGMFMRGWKQSKGHRANLLFKGRGTLSPMGAVAISCSCKGGPEDSNWCYAAFLVRKRVSSDDPPRYGK